jgi:hypothetical protein
MADNLKQWIHHWQDEGDAAFLYGILAAQEPDPKKRDIYDKLAGVERRHTEIRAPPRPSTHARWRGWAAVSARTTSCRCCCAKRVAR